MFSNSNLAPSSSGGLQQVEATACRLVAGGGPNSHHFVGQHHFNGHAGNLLGQPHATTALIMTNRSQLSQPNLPQATQFYNQPEIAYVNVMNAERFASQPIDSNQNNLIRVEQHTTLAICDSNGGLTRCAPNDFPKPIQADCLALAKRPSQIQGESLGLNVINDSSNSVAARASPQKGSGQKRKRARGAEGHKERVRVPCASFQSSRQTFACPTCSKQFTEKFNMKRHMQVHSHTRPKFACNECSKTFAWRDNFTRHRKAVHNKSGGRAELTFVAH